MFFQVAFYILVRPMSKNLYRRINKVVVELLWLELIWLIDWWAGVKVCKLLLIAYFIFGLAYRKCPITHGRKHNLICWTFILRHKCNPIFVYYACSVKNFFHQLIWILQLLLSCDYNIVLVSHRIIGQDRLTHFLRLDEISY